MGRRAQLAMLALAMAASRSAVAESDAEAVSAFEAQVNDSKVQLGFLHDLIDRGEISSLERAKQLFNESETQFLLENYEGAAAGLLEAVSVQAYHTEPTYVQALYYLAESLYKTENYVEAKHYFRQAVALMTPGKDSRYQDCIVRLIRLSELTGDAQGVDQYYDVAKQAGGLRAEVTYLYAKWVANRLDLPLDERAGRADADFARIQPGQSFYPQATYYRAALKVQQGKLDEAIPLFETVEKLPTPKTDPKSRRMHDLALLGVARCLAEQGKYTEALEKYHALASDSEEYVDALFERAEVLVRMGNPEEALRTAETLLVVGKGTSVEPEARILHANLLLKLGATNHDDYDKASEDFTALVQNYKPVRDQVQAIIDRPDPVKYFDDLFRREPGTDFTRQLPKAAQGFVDPTAEVRSATNIQRELASSNKDVKDSGELAQKLLDILSKGGLDMFPQLREANGRAVQMSNTLVRLENELVRLQVKLVGDSVPPDVKAQLDRLEADRARLDAKFQQLPKNQAEYDRRLKTFRERIAGLERKLFAVQREIDSESAQLNGLVKFWHDSLASRHLTQAQLEEGEKDLAQWQQLVSQLQGRRDDIDRQLSSEKLNLIAQANGGREEEALRAAYHDQLTSMQNILSRVLPTVSAENRPLLDRVSKARAAIDEQQKTLTQLRIQLRQRADEKANSFRQRIVAEQLKLGDYHGQIDSFSGQSGQLIGQIAVDAYKQVAKQFYDIVLKGDVGIIDVAWTRKQEHTDQIGKYGKEREEALKVMQDRYKEVLRDVQ